MAIRRIHSFKLWIWSAPSSATIRASRWSALPLLTTLLALLTLSACRSTSSTSSLAEGAAPALVPVTEITDASAHWILPDRVIWQVPAGAHRYELRYDRDGAISVSAEGVSGGTPLALRPGAELTFVVADRHRHIAAWPVFSLQADRALIAQAIRGQLVAIAYNRAGEPVAATRVQFPGVIDALFAYDGELGPLYTDNELVLRVWAPTARKVTLRRYDADKSLISEDAPAETDPTTGVYTFHGPRADWDRQFYRFHIEVYHYQTGRVEQYEVTDPYSVSLSTDSQFSQFADISEDASLKPDGWDTLRKTLPHASDITLYEGHVRDFSYWDASVAPEHRGTYRAFTYNGMSGRPLSSGMAHLERLAQAGLSHLHLLPVNDITTVIEDPSRRIDLDMPFSTLCEQLHPDVVGANALVADCRRYGETPIREVFAQMAAEDPAHDGPQRPYNAYRSSGNRGSQPGMASFDGFNWGYDPFHFNTPEGSYATTAEGAQRILEFREMVQALHEIGLLLVVDVVYNHTSAYGLNDRSVLDKVVPGYYQRYSPVTGAIETSTCCPNTASEHVMMEKLMIDSILLWAQYYKVDSFRFDLMGHHSLQTMRRIQQALTALTLEEHGVDGSSVYIYGEGWNFGEVADNRIFDQATQFMSAGSGIGNFNDRLRDGIRGRNFTDVGRRQGFVSGMYLFPNEAETRDPAAQRVDLLYQADQIRVGLAGNLRTYPYVDRSGRLGVGGRDGIGYTLIPSENVNYIDKHDNETLWDNTQTKLPVDMSLAERVRIHMLSNAFVNFGQGVPFFHMGTDFLRSKSLDRNSYDSGDWFNRVDFTLQTHNWGTGLPPQWDNANRWSEMVPLLRNPNMKAGPEALQLAHGLFLEQLQIRYSSPLFRLRSAEDVHRRVRFHNVGPDQVAGLIVMTISDGVCAGRSLDATYDGVLVVFNASRETQQIALGLPNMVLHPVQATGLDTVVQEARNDNGVFTVPGLTAAVFVQTVQEPLQQFPCNIH